MGRATVISGGADGLYTINLDFGTAAKAATLSYVNATILEQEPKVAEAKTNYDIQKINEDAARTLAQDAVDAYVAATVAQAAAVKAQEDARIAHEAIASDPGADPAAVLAAKDALTAAGAALAAAQEDTKKKDTAYKDAIAKLRKDTFTTLPLRHTHDQLKTGLAKLKKDLVYWTNVEAEKTMSAWCADFTEDASGVVATIEAPGEDQRVLIAPGGSIPAHDGLLLARELQRPEQAFFNAAILPGWQKFKPTYRHGTITGIDEDGNTANVSLSSDVSSAQGLDINQTSSLSAVPVAYMECNVAAFTVGDTCLVEFIGQDWAAPRIIGFGSEPKPCPFRLQYIATPAFFPTQPTNNDQRVGLGRDAKTVFAAAPFIYYLPAVAPVVVNSVGFAWIGWDDGVTTLSRQDMNVAAPFTRYARYLMFDALNAVAFGVRGVGVNEYYKDTGLAQGDYVYESGDTVAGPFSTFEEAENYRLPEFVMSRIYAPTGKKFFLTYTHIGGPSHAYVVTAMSDFYV